MDFNEEFTTNEIVDIFKEEITSQGGEIIDSQYCRGQHYIRSILPFVREMRRGDMVNGGVALKVSQKSVWIHPYLFRQICSNGAIMARATQTRHFENIDELTPVIAELELREAVRACCSEDAFSVSAEQMRTTQEKAVDMELTLLSLTARVQPQRRSTIRSLVKYEFERGKDRSQYGMLNAVTAVARYIPNPDMQWCLEEFAGEMVIDETYSLFQEHFATDVLNVV